jgi:hypothetical protein
MKSFLPKIVVLAFIGSISINTYALQCPSAQTVQDAWNNSQAINPTFSDDTTGFSTIWEFVGDKHSVESRLKITDLIATYAKTKLTNGTEPNNSVVNCIYISNSADPSWKYFPVIQYNPTPAAPYIGVTGNWVTNYKDNCGGSNCTFRQDISK